MPTSRKGFSLALRIQVQIGLAIALVTACGTFLTYRHTIDTIRTETLEALQSAVTTRAGYESQPFLDAQNNTAALRDEFLRRMAQPATTKAQTDFDHWFTRSPDGLIRVRPALDDHKHLPSVYIRPAVELTGELKRNVVFAFDLLREWGPMMTQKYYSAYIDLPGTSLIMFSPSVNWGKDADTTTNNMDYPPMQNSSPSRNPARRNSWTEIYFDDKAAIWMLSTLTPIDRQGEWVGTASQDIAVDALLKRTANEFAPGTYNMILDGSGALLAHPDLMEKIRKSSGNLKVSTLEDRLLTGFVKEVAMLRGVAQVRESPDGGYFLGISRIEGPNWYFVTVYPKALLQARAYASIEGIVLTGLVALLVELLLLAWIIRRQVTAPLGELNLAAARVAAGNLDVNLNLQGGDELSQLGHSFSNMAARLLERDLALKQRALELEHEVNERLASEQRILHMATHDILTGLANRSLLQDRLQQAIISAERNAGNVAVLFIDLDHFKNINDTLGHDTGDSVLKRVSRTMSQLLRKSDTLCRFGGDEFVLLLPVLANAEDAVLIADKFLLGLSQTIDIGGANFTLTASIGISIYPTDGADGDALIRNADIAMYRAKEAGRNGCQCYTAEMGLRAGDTLRLEAAIRQAVALEELVLYFQPKVLAQGHRVVAAEALIRWQRPGHGLLSPATFIPFAEERKLMQMIDHFVLHSTCRQIARWQAQGLPVVPIAVNLSSGQFADTEFVGNLKQLLNESQVAPQLLKLEITEGVLLHESNVVESNLAALRSLGIRISIDDFGTGYSSLSYLHRFPIDELKIDRSFVQNIVEPTDDSPLIRAIIGIARDLNMSLVAEGVETAGQAEFLRTHGCDELQGYFFYRPMPADAFSDVLMAQGGRMPS